MIKELENSLYNAINSICNTSIDKLDMDFDYNNIGCFFKLNSPSASGNENSFTMQDFYYAEQMLKPQSGNRNTFILQVYLISQQINKSEMEQIAENIDNCINNKALNCNAIVRHVNVWLDEFIDSDLQNIIMTYKVDQF